MNRLKSRSPYLVTYNIANLTSAVIELFVYEGTQTTSRPPTATVTLQIEAYNDTINADLSPFVEDALEVSFDGAYNSLVVWVDYQITPYVSEVAQTPLTMVQLSGFSGFRDFTEGAQNISLADDTNKVLISNRKIYIPKDKYINLPIVKDSSYYVSFIDKDNKVSYSESITSTTASANRMYCISNSGTAGIDSFIDRVTQDGGVVESIDCLNNSLCVYSFDLSKIIVDDEVITIEELPPSIYPYYKVTFINKFGAPQDVWFTGKSDIKLKTTQTNTFKKNILTNDSYSISDHSNETQSKNGIESISLSTGFLDEGHNEVFRQMLLSKYSWVEINGDTLPITITDSSLSYKTIANDKLIVFSIKADFSFNTINDIR